MNWNAIVAVTIGVLSISAAAEEPSGELARRLAGVTFEQYAAAPGYSEGPTWRDGEVLFCSGTLLRVDAARKVHKYLEINPAGTVLRGDGHVLICDNKHTALLDLAPDGKVEVVVEQADPANHEQFATQSLKSLNDLTIDARGNVYFTDPEGSSLEKPIGKVFRVRPDGRVDRVATGLAFPNGLDVDPAGKFLYVVESQSKKILRYPVPADDEPLGKPETFYDLGGSGGDGCAFDAAGNFWVADFSRPETGKGRITVLSPDARVLAYLPVPAKVVSNIAFGGPAHDEIFCTSGELAGVFHAKVGVKGFAGHPGKPMRMVRTLDVVAMRPHVDAEALGKLAAAAAEAKVEAGQADAATRQQMRSMAGGLSDAALRADVEKFLPAWEEAAGRHARDQALLAEIKRLKGKANTEIAAPAWLRAIVGDSALASLGRIVELELNERSDGHKAPEPKAMADRVTDDWLKNLADQGELRRLELSGTAVTSAGLIHLKNLTKMERLNVCLTAVDDRGFEHLAGMTRMRRMVVCASKITGSGFGHLGGMKELESINLHSSPASDEGLEAIGKLTNLRRLEVVHTQVTDAGLKHLAGLVNLRQLHVHGPKMTEAGLAVVGGLKELYQFDVYDKASSNVTLEQVGLLGKLRFLSLHGGGFDDKGVKHLAKVTTLEEATLDSANVTDASVEVLGRLTNLRKLNLGRCKITPAGRERLAAMLPKTEIKP